MHVIERGGGASAGRRPAIWLYSLEVMPITYTLVATIVRLL